MEPDTTKQSEEIRLTKGVLAGRTEEEVIDEYNKLVAGYQTLAQQVQQQQQQQMQQPEITADMLDNPEEYARQLKAQITQEVMQSVGQAAQPLFQGQDKTAKALSQQNPKNEIVYKRWGAEVDRMVANVPLAQRTVELYDRAADMVRGQHTDEIIKEEVQRQLASSGGGGDSLASANGVAGDKLPSEDVSAFEKLEKTSYGKHLLKTQTKQDILKYVNARGMTLDAYVEQVSKTNARIDPGNPAALRNEKVV